MQVVHCTGQCRGFVVVVVVVVVWVLLKALITANGKPPMKTMHGADAAASLKSCRTFASDSPVHSRCINSFQKVSIGLAPQSVELLRNS